LVIALAGHGNLNLGLAAPIKQCADQAIYRGNKLNIVVRENRPAGVVPATSVAAYHGPAVLEITWEQPVGGVMPVVELQPTVESHQADYGAQIEHRGYSAGVEHGNIKYYDQFLMSRDQKSMSKRTPALTHTIHSDSVQRVIPTMSLLITAYLMKGSIFAETFFRAVVTAENK